MKIIRQGKFELSTNKADAIDKFMQLQGLCKEEIGDDIPVHFICSKKGKLGITNVTARRNVNHFNATHLVGEVIEEEGKTFVCYRIEYMEMLNGLKLIYFLVLIVLGTLSIVLAVADVDRTVVPILSLLYLLFFIYQLFATTQEEKTAPNDSQLLINELKSRVDAVNLWDK